MTEIWHYSRGFVGMSIAALLFMAGLTGAILAFYNDVDKVLNPIFYHVKPSGKLLAPPVLIAKLEQARPEILVWYQQYPKIPGETAMMSAQARPNAQGTYPAIQSDIFYVNPYTAEIVGEKYWGKCCLEPENLLNFLYELHHSLKRGFWGNYLMGLSAVALLINCLWVLLGSKGRSKSGSSVFLIPTHHRPVAIMLAILLLPVAISGIAMNLPVEVFKPVVSIFSPVQPSIYEEYAGKTSPDFGSRILSYDEAYQLAQETGRQNGWSEPVAELFYSTGYNFYGMAFGYRDPDGMGNNWIYLDGVDGHPVGEKHPTQGSAGDILSFAQLPIHSGRIAGVASKTLIAILGLLVAALSARYILITSRLLSLGSKS